MYWKDCNTRPRFIKSSDPDNYGFACPHCYKRWGEPQIGGFIDITRCSKCPPLSGMIQLESVKKKTKRDRRYKQ